ncbi:MAG: hypothetical protein AABY69_00085 [Nitrospirota bacterium]
MKKGKMRRRVRDCHCRSQEEWASIIGGHATFGGYACQGAHLD